MSGWPSPLPGELERRLDRPRGTVRYRLRRAAQPRGIIVLIHGLASNLTRWAEFIEHTSLKDEWDILRIDLRGHGESRTRGAIDMELWCDDIAAVLDAERHARAVVVGHSLGAHVAVFLAARLPERVRAIALIDPLLREAARGKTRWLFPAVPLLRLLSWLLRVLNTVGIRRRVIPPRDLRALDEQTRALLARLGDSSAIVDKYISPTADLRHIRTAYYFRDLAEMFRPLPLDRVRAPTLAVLSRGLTFSDLAVTRERLSRFAHAELVEIDAYHWPLTEKPAEVRCAIEDWCRRLPEGPGDSRAA
jgi:pimeloyl-ACP methyl ester carboxylesterase